MERDLRLDGLKFCLIFLVVLAHFGYGWSFFDLNKVIYSFHMPLFVFLSGFFTGRLNKEKFVKWAKKIFLLFMVANVGHIVLAVTLFCLGAIKKQGVMDFSIINLDLFIVPRFAMWYLLCLIYWRFLALICFDKIKKNILLFISMLASFALGFVPIDGEFSFQRAFAFLPFFIAGFIFKEKNLLEKINRYPKILSVSLFVMCSIAALYLPVFMPSEHYQNGTWFFLRIVQTAMAFVMCLSLLNISRFDVFERFSKYGRYTIWIYIGHTYLIIVGYKLIPYLGIQLNAAIVFLLSVLYCFLFVSLAKVCEYSQKKKNSAG